MEITLPYTYNGRESHREAIDSCKTKVGKFDTSVSRDEDILWFEIAVYNPVRMYEIDPF